jgi:hypothetical protein
VQLKIIPKSEIAAPEIMYFDLDSVRASTLTARAPCPLANTYYSYILLLSVIVTERYALASEIPLSTLSLLVRQYLDILISSDVDIE